MRRMLEQVLGSRTRAKIFRLLLTNPEKSYFVREMSRKIGEHINSIRRELQLLTAIGIVAANGDGQKRYYQANLAFPLFPELKAVIFKAQVMEEGALLSGLAESGRLHLVLLTGYFVGLPEAPTDILVVGAVNRLKLRKILRLFQQHFDRDIHYTVMTTKEFQFRYSLTDRFLYTILADPYITIVDKRKKIES